MRTFLLTIIYLSYYTHTLTLRHFHILIVHTFAHSPSLRLRILELEIPLEVNESNR